MDAETELTDKTRWMKMEPPDVIAQIMSLDLTNAASRVAFSASNEEDHELEDKQLDLLDENLWCDGKEQDPQEQEQEEPVETLLDEPSTSTSKPYMITNIVTLHKALKSGAEVLVGEDIWDAGMEPTPGTGTVSNTAATTTTPTTAEQTIDTQDMSQETKLLLAALKREVLLLRNELNFELFLKQQHLQHIGRLHREHVLDTSVEAERQQLVSDQVTFPSF
jgi:septal ring-binding cell division protein DamX